MGELLAAVVISLMLASGRALEGWAAGRARRDLTGLLERAPRTARRYQGEALETVPLDEVLPGDKLLIAKGDVVPADGSIVSGQAILDDRPARSPLTRGLVSGDMEPALRRRQP